MSEPGQQEIQQWQPEHPDTVSSSAWEVTPAPPAWVHPSQGPSAQQNTGRAGCLGLLLTELSTQSWEQPTGFGLQTSAKHLRG